MAFKIRSPSASARNDMNRHFDVSFENDTSFCQAAALHRKRPMERAQGKSAAKIADAGPLQKRAVVAGQIGLEEKGALVSPPTE